MSALWRPVSSTKSSTQILSQPFQLREVPRLFAAFYYDSKPTQQILPIVFQNLTSNWLYGAFSQLTVNASEPAWSQNGWSFVPVSFENLSLSQQSNRPSTEIVNATVTVTVPALHGRLECALLAPDLDSKYYTTPVNVSQWNATGRELSPSDAYFLLGCSDYPGYAAPMINFDPDPDTTVRCEYLQSATSLLTATIPPTCCGVDGDGLPENGIFSYWTPVFTHDDEGGRESFPSGRDIVVKTLYGPAPKQANNNINTNIHGLLWPEPPSLAMLRCTPIIETASSTVTIDIGTQQVKNYTLLETPVSFEAAWSNDYLAHNMWNGEGNVTLSFGPLFMSALLGAAQLNFLGGCLDVAASPCYENSNDQTFNYHAAGMSMDYMSYSMFALSNNNMSAMLDYTRMIPLAQKVFTTFFQHFVSSNVLLNGTGGWAYQRATETLPADLQPPLNQTSNPSAQVSQTAAPTVTAIITEPIEKLQMSPVAVYLCLLILFWLLVTTILILVLKKRYFSTLLQPTETVADVARLVAYSDCYLELAAARGATGLRRNKMFRTRLGWFRGRSDGQARWGIELADDPRVEWLDEDEIGRLRGGESE